MALVALEIISVDTNLCTAMTEVNIR